MITVITVAFAKIDTNTIGTILKPNVQTPVKAIRVPTKNIPTVIAVFSILRQHTNAVVSKATIGNTLIALKTAIPVNRIRAGRQNIQTEPALYSMVIITAAALKDTHGTANQKNVLRIKSLTKIQMQTRMKRLIPTIQKMENNMKLLLLLIAHLLENR